MTNWILLNVNIIFARQSPVLSNLVPRACDPREGTRGSGIIRCRKPGILAKIELRTPFQRLIRFLPETDYPRASRSFPKIAGSGNEIESCHTFNQNFVLLFVFHFVLLLKQNLVLLFVFSSCSSRAISFHICV